METNKPTHIVKGNIFDALGFSASEASALKVKAEILSAILEHIRKEGYTQAQLVNRLDEHQPSISNLLAGRIEQVSIEKMLSYADQLGLKASIAVLPTQAAMSSMRVHSAAEIEKHNRSASMLRYFIKKHDATTLHYDFRFGCNGILWSWAIDVGPSYCPAYKRSATRVRNHRQEHGLFEGVFAEGTYGAGPTILWDEGFLKPLPEYSDVEESIRKGRFKFGLNGQKLKGNWTLIWREGNKSSGLGSKWHFIKEPDSFARSEKAECILDEEPNSILTGKSLEETRRDWVEGTKKGRPQSGLFDADR